MIRPEGFALPPRVSLSTLGCLGCLLLVAKWRTLLTLSSSTSCECAKLVGITEVRETNGTGFESFEVLVDSSPLLRLDDTPQSGEILFLRCHDFLANIQLVVFFHYHFTIVSGWWFQLLWTIWKSTGMITPNIYGKKNKGSKPPASITVVHGVYRPTYITIKLLHTDPEVCPSPE